MGRRGSPKAKLLDQAHRSSHGACSASTQTGAWARWEQQLFQTLAGSCPPPWARRMPTILVLHSLSFLAWKGAIKSPAVQHSTWLTGFQSSSLALATPAQVGQRKDNFDPQREKCKSTKPWEPQRAQEEKKDKLIKFLNTNNSLEVQGYQVQVRVLFYFILHLYYCWLKATMPDRAGAQKLLLNNTHTTDPGTKVSVMVTINLTVTIILKGNMDGLSNYL